MNVCRRHVNTEVNVRTGSTSTRVPASLGTQESTVKQVSKFKQVNQCIVKQVSQCTYMQVSQCIVKQVSQCTYMQVSQCIVKQVSKYKQVNQYIVKQVSKYKQVKQCIAKQVAVSRFEFKQDSYCNMKQISQCKQVNKCIVKPKVCCICVSDLPDVIKEWSPITRITYNDTF